MCGGYTKYIGPTFRTSLYPGPMGRGSHGRINAHSSDNTAWMHALPQSGTPIGPGRSLLEAAPVAHPVCI
jgi:hypothetical protein